MNWASWKMKNPLIWWPCRWAKVWKIKCIRHDWIRQCCSLMGNFMVTGTSNASGWWTFLSGRALDKSGSPPYSQPSLALVPRSLVLPSPPMPATSGSHLPQINHLPPLCAPPSVTRGQENRLATRGSKDWGRGNDQHFSLLHQRLPFVEGRLA